MARKKSRKVVRRTRRTQLEVVATVILKRPAEMSKKGRRQIAAWLRSRAKLLLSHADLMSHRFTARYYAKKGK